MKTCHPSSPLMLLWLIYISVLPVVEAESINVSPEVTGFLGHDVTLPCQFIPTEPNSHVTQVEWDLLLPGEKKITIIVFNSEFGVHINHSSLEDRVELREQSLVIKNVAVSDAGLYQCIITTFPGGPLKGKIKLIVREQMTLSAGVVSAIVIVVILLIMITAVTVYFIFIRRNNSLVRHRVLVDTGGTAMGGTRPSVIIRDEDVVYSGVKFRSPGDAPPSSNLKRMAATGEDVTYATVLIRGQELESGFI